MKQRKQRDFESKDFEVTCGADCRMHMVGDGGLSVSLNPRKGRVKNKDGKDDAAMTLLSDNPKMSARDVVALLGEHGIKRSKTWVLERRYEMQQADAPDTN